MTLLDRYVWRIVLGAFGAGLLFFLFLTILLDLFNSLPKYAARAAEHGLGSIDLAAYLAVYYVKLLPVLFTSVTPFVSVIAGMFTVARLQTANEVVAMLFVGRSIRRVLRPILLCGALGGVAMAACWQWVVPHVGASIVEAESFLRESRPEYRRLVHEVESPVGGETLRLYVHTFDPAAAKMRGVRMLSESPLEIENSQLSADAATWDEARKDWRLDGGRITTRAGERPVEWLGRPELTPALLLQRSRDHIDPETLSYSDLLDLVRTRPNDPSFRLALHRHVTYTLSCVLLLLLALPMAVFYERGSRLRRLLAAIALCGGYALMDLTCQSLGRQGLHPVVAAWSPVIVFGSLGVVLWTGTKT